jgi:hypothetical protein
MRYDYLVFGSSKVRVGEIVTAGQEIAEVGMTVQLFLRQTFLRSKKIVSSKTAILGEV